MKHVQITQYQTYTHTNQATTTTKTKKILRESACVCCVYYEFMNMNGVRIRTILSIHHTMNDDR